MQRKIIVGYDGSDQARDALAFGRLLAGATGATLVLAHVFPYEPVRWRGANADYERVLREDSEAVLRAAVGEPSGAVTITTRAIPSNSVPRALHGLAAAEDADLIVLGSTHRGRLGRVLPGSVGLRVLHSSPCAVAVAPRGYAEGPEPAVRMIGVAYDASHEARDALRVAADLATATGAAMRVFTVEEPLGVGEVGMASATVYAELAGYQRERLQRDLDEALASLPASLPAEGRLLSGLAAPSILEAAEGIDLLVTGSRGYGPIRHVLLGGVSEELIRSAPCPVIVLPRGGHVHTDTGEPAADASGASR